MLTFAAICGRAFIVYPIELCLGIVIAWCMGKYTLEIQREQYYLLSSKSFINEIFAYKGNLVWTVLFVCLAYVQIATKCRNYVILPQYQGNVPNYPMRGLLKQYASKFILKNVLLMLIFWVIDGIFILTGGSCLTRADTYSAEKCKASGAQWVGGFDISGHFCFLVNISMILWLELSQYWKYVEQDAVVLPASRLIKVCLIITVSVLVIWIAMLMITSIYYHTVLEKVLGCLMGYICVTVMYWLIPRSPFCNKLFYC
ncbi:hypothetical protein HG536_0E02900 [Torulaspora globosa]|uniref:Acyl-coenzyme A diphosphatase YFT2 n=1 Tax=Torulaspora globosa TaxID=48254 RepID=A0A7G3ZIP3_9SACH|nr:uncharacterized protein HG536_0E02900 [Torulaspora globosa]QLL33379.1 hypothetical protein HG536_0E02900 [Torulaspora globosa]